MAYCKVNQAEIYYEEIGEGKPILLIHRFTPDHRLMKGCMEPIFAERDGWRRIYIDLPGRETKNYNGINSSDDMLNALIDFIETVLPDQDYIVAGESYSGYLARGLIEKQKERVLGAAFICPVIIPKKEYRTVPEHSIMRKDAELIRKLTQEELADFSSNQVILDEYNWERYKNEVLAGCKIADETLLEKVMGNYEFSLKVDQMPYTRPSLFLLGRQDSTVGYQDALAIIDKYPRGTFTVLDVAGHNLQIEQPQLFHSLVNEWLDRTEELL